MTVRARTPGPLLVLPLLGGKDGAWRARNGEWGGLESASAHFIPIMKVWREWSAWSLALRGDARVPGRVLGKRNELGRLEWGLPAA